MIWKFLKQNVLFPKGLNWVQHWVSRIGLLRAFFPGKKKLFIRSLSSFVHRGILQFQSPHPQEFATQGKKMLMPWGQPLGEAGVGAAIID